MLLDITRLIGRAHRAGPSGIDRIELAYAQYFLGDSASRPAYAVIHLFGRLFGVHPGSARRFVAAVAARWRGDAPRTSVPGLYAKLLGGHWMAGWQLRRRLRDHASPPIYLVVSHHHLEHAARLTRIRRVFRACIAAFLHDLIPLDFPQYVEPSTARNHERIVATLSRCCDAVLVNSNFTAAHFREYLGRGAVDAGAAAGPAVHVALPGVRQFPLPPARDALARRDSPPYFVILGTIEPKKNHLLLLNVWAGLARTVARPPRLLVIGARGWQNQQVVEMLERSAREHGLVEEYNHLDDAAIGALLAGACAVLVPSFVEGFGLPLGEALASGVPVICSDIAAFREIGGTAPDFLSPLDPTAWREAVIAYAEPASRRRAAQLQRLRHWPVPTWDAHFEVVRRALDGIGQAVVPE